MKKNIWIIPVSLLFIAILLFTIFSRYQKAICGDGICQKIELEKDICDLDCLDICIQATASTIENIEQECSLGWESVYIELLSEDIIKENWLQETEEIDFSNPQIQELAKQLKKETPKETAKAIAKWTYENINYDSTDKYFDCFNIKASDILERHSGVCSTMSKLNIALLRANRIPAFSVTGCWKFNTACNLVQTFYKDIIPKFIDIKVDESGYAPTMGYLHNWVIFPLYENEEIEYVLLESTSGKLYEDKCINYREYYLDPLDSTVCGLLSVNPNLQDCMGW